MPSKGKKTASRQAGLRDRKKRGKGGSQQFQAAPTSRNVDAEDGTPVVAATSFSDTTSSIPQAGRTPRLSRRTRQAAAAEVGNYPFLGSELRQIGVIASGIVAIIVALSFVLG